MEISTRADEVVIDQKPVRRKDNRTSDVSGFNTAQVDIAQVETSQVGISQIGTGADFLPITHARTFQSPRTTCFSLV